MGNPTPPRDEPDGSWIEANATALASTTPHTFAYWHRELAAVSHHPDRDVIVRVASETNLRPSSVLRLLPFEFLMTPQRNEQR